MVVAARSEGVTRRPDRIKASLARKGRQVNRRKLPGIGVDRRRAAKMHQKHTIPRRKPARRLQIDQAANGPPFVNRVGDQPLCRRQHLNAVFDRVVRKPIVSVIRCDHFHIRLGHQWRQAKGLQSIIGKLSHAPRLDLRLTIIRHANDMRFDAKRPEPGQ